MMKPIRRLAGLALLAALALALTLTATSPLSAQDDAAQTFVVSIDAVADFAYKDSGSFTTALGAAAPGPAMPGQAFEISFNGAPGDRLTFATMLGESNDYFFAPDELGIPLHRPDGAAMAGDVTAYVKLWDAGTEADEPLGVGPNQAPRQPAPNPGPADPTRTVRRVLMDGVPAVSEMVHATLRAAGTNRFTLRIENVSGDSSLPTPLSPGVVVVHADPGPLFTNGMADRGMGLERIAEDGMADALAAAVAADTGINTALSPLAWAVTGESHVIFSAGARASAGLEMLAEDGMPDTLAASLAAFQSGAVSVGRGAAAPGPIMPPAGNFSFEITASPGEMLSLATMFGESNDWFYTLADQPLFDAAGRPIQGDFTHMVQLYDAGTEANEPPGFGPNQAPRQPALNTGPAEGSVVRLVTDPRFTDPAAVLHLTITPAG
jgi:hypothetical protein